MKFVRAWSREIFVDEDEEFDEDLIAADGSGALEADENVEDVECDEEVDEDDAWTWTRRTTMSLLLCLLVSRRNALFISICS